MDTIKLGKFIGALQRRFQTATNRELTLPEINASNANFLLFISEHDRVTAKQITTELAINKGLVSREMTRLENAGYVTRVPDATDRRATWVSITPKGLTACETIRQIKQALWDQVLVDTSAADVEVFFNQLASLSERAKVFDHLQ
ncbi:MarR family winged helix-turn-helix transcriptional regulator [Levilactobacillus tongjiangensis]|uniref:MarR family winged helix-turn-helix transcriptional regulator n=1 Tax=Levilactobacillus tongjiangensis TaxID=2486023 RepID=A0ABW1SV10_9LACO|nr:MarR family winged helix-turn-helix transcriptional regulator [Levilactobacillus tongjiangensis]